MGRIRTIRDMQQVLKAGADKVSTNSAAVANPSLITEAKEQFGSQCIVVAIDAKKTTPSKWEVFVSGGQKSTGLYNILDVIAAILMLLFHSPHPPFISQAYPALIVWAEIVFSLWNRILFIESASDVIETILSAVTLLKFPAEVIFFIFHFLMRISGYYYSFPGSHPKKGKWFTDKNLGKPSIVLREFADKIGAKVGNLLKKLISPMMTALYYVLPEILVNKLLFDMPISVQGIYNPLFGRSPPLYFNKGVFWASIQDLRTINYIKMDTPDGAGGLDVLEKFIAGLTTFELLLTFVNQLIIKTMFS